MNVDLTLNGSWVGFYEYGHGYPEKLKGRKTFFEAALGQNRTSFIGKVKEINEMGDMDQASVEGTLIEDRIIFAKRPTKAYTLDENENIIPVAVHVDVILYYQGDFIRTENKFIGAWSNASTGMTTPPGGTWEMWKKPEKNLKE